MDELSAWYPPSSAPSSSGARAHSAYAEWATAALPLDDGERAMLARHVKLRAKRGWGALDQAFAVDAPVAAAAEAAAAAQKRLLAPADAEDERALLEHFAPRLDAAPRREEGTIAAVEAALASELARAAPLFAQLGRFCEVTETVPVRAVLVPSPASVPDEGRLARRAIVLEIAASPTATRDAVAALLHLFADGVLVQRRGSIATGARKCAEPVDDETLEAGLAYAFAPGLVHPAGSDLLRDAVAAEQRSPLRDPRVRAERLGLALRTELSAALEGGSETLGAFLPTACDAWANVVRR